MNNDLEQFSEERLNRIIEGHSFPITQEVKVLARIALSVKQAKPVGRIEGWNDHEDIYIIQWFGNQQDLPKGSALYTTPQPAHTERDDTRRMNWLVSQHVEVRTPMVYGSHARFVAQCDSDDCEEYHTTLREQIDKAMLAAPKPESE